MELFLIYLWLKLDTFHITILVLSSLTVLLLLGWLFVYGVGYPAYQRESWKESHQSGFKKVKPYLITLSFLYGVSLLAPTSKDVAILVGASIAIDTMKSPEAQKVGQLLRGKANELLDAEIKKLTPAK